VLVALHHSKFKSFTESFFMPTRTRKYTRKFE